MTHYNYKKARWQYQYEYFDGRKETHDVILANYTDQDVQDYYALIDLQRREILNWIKDDSHSEYDVVDEMLEELAEIDIDLKRVDN